MSKNWSAEHVAELTEHFLEMPDASWAIQFGVTESAVKSKRTALGLLRKPDLSEHQASANAQRALLRAAIETSPPGRQPEPGFTVPAMPDASDRHHAVRISGGVTIAHGCVNPLTGRLSWPAMQQAMGAGR